MSDEILIQVEGVRKKFCRNLKRSMLYGVSDIVADLNPFAPAEQASQRTNRLRADEFWAVDDVSFELRRGQCLGLIGRNGAGKTTLLKMLNGLIKPDAGSITMRGRVSALIALGAGFNPILTGRENIYVNGSVLGLTKREIDAKLEEIIAFSEIGEFVDAPVQGYSSGMQVRLGFAIASALHPDILLLDEVFAVGDESFRLKCRNRIGELLPTCAVIFVSHNLGEVARICDHFLVLQRGRNSYCGTNKTEAISKYRYQGEVLPPQIVNEGANIASFRLEPAGNHATRVVLDVIFAASIKEFSINLAISDHSGRVLAMRSSVDDGGVFLPRPGRQQVAFTVNHDFLVNGNYYFQISIVEPRGPTVHARLFNTVTFTVAREGFGYADIAPRVEWTPPAPA